MWLENTGDHLNTPQVITNTNQQVVWKVENQSPFGGAEIDQDPDGDGEELVFNLRFPGQYFDSETGLYYNYYRDYDPTIGRYIQSDPIGLDGGLNTYAYVNGNPLIYSDPYGLARQFGFGFSATVAVFLGANVSVTPFGISIPDDWKNWRCYQFYASASMASMASMAGGGAYAGAGGAFSFGSTSGSMPSGFSTSVSRYWEAGAGWGVSGGASQQGAVNLDGEDWSTVLDGWDNDPGSSTSIAVKPGVGYGAYVGLGFSSNFNATSPTWGDECECQ